MENHTSWRTSRKSKIRFWFLALGVWLFLSCELPVEEVGYEEKLVVFGNLITNSPIIDTVFVSRSYEIDDPHEKEEKWVPDALVTIVGGNNIIDLSPVVDRPGRYLAPMLENPIHPNTAYTLEVEWNSYTVTATTITPDSLSIRSVGSSAWECDGEPVWVDSIDLHETENEFPIQLAFFTDNLNILFTLPMDTVVYREGPCYTTSFASVPIFIVNWESKTEPGMIRAMSWALEDTITNAIVDTSFSADAFKGPMHKDEDGNYFRPNPVVWNLSQEMLDFGWLSFNYYGVHLMVIEATDQSFYDYFQGDPFRQNQYILPNSNIEGGYGLFSSSFYRYFLVYVAPDTSGK